LAALPASAAGNESDLKLLIAMDQATVNEPFPARIRLQLHNAGQRPLWLYTPVRDASVLSQASNPFSGENSVEGATTGGAYLDVHLIPADSSTPEESASGRVLEVAGFPHPKLIEIGPGDDYEEAALVRLRPASIAHDGEEQRLWGAYTLAVTYRAQYSNGPNLRAILGTNIWEGEAESNRVDVELRQAPQDARGAVSGSVIDARMQPVFGFLVTLSDQDGQPIGQSFSDENGKFAFSHLPFGFYWLNARPRNANEDAGVLRHVTPSASDPEESVQLVLIPQEVHHPEQLLHKPVLFRVFHSRDKPYAGVDLDDVWSTGTVSDHVRGQTNKNGSIALQLIPGRNFVTMKLKGCGNQDERVDVAPGVGIEGFRLDFDCQKK
jgi:hypothetical protein